MIDRALPDALVKKARRAIAGMRKTPLRESYFTTFWLPRGRAPANAIEEAVARLSRKLGGRHAGCEWWIGRAWTTHIPIGFHFDLDTRGSGRTRHPARSSVFFFNSVRGGQLAITDQTPGSHGEPHPAAPTRLQTIKPKRNRWAHFDGRLFHGVLDARGHTPGRPLKGPRGRLRVTLVVNFWAERPHGVPEFSARAAGAGRRTR